MEKNQQEIIVTDIKMPFMSMVVFMVKFAILGAVFGGIFHGMNRY